MSLAASRKATKPLVKMLSDASSAPASVLPLIAALAMKVSRKKSKAVVRVFCHPNTGGLRLLNSILEAHSGSVTVAESVCSLLHALLAHPERVAARVVTRMSRIGILSTLLSILSQHAPTSLSCGSLLKAPADCTLEAPVASFLTRLLPVAAALWTSLPPMPTFPAPLTRPGSAFPGSRMGSIAADVSCLVGCVFVHVHSLVRGASGTLSLRQFDATHHAASSQGDGRGCGGGGGGAMESEDAVRACLSVLRAAVADVGGSRASSRRTFQVATALSPHVREPTARRVSQAFTHASSDPLSPASDPCGRQFGLASAFPFGCGTAAPTSAPWDALAAARTDVAAAASEHGTANECARDDDAAPSTGADDDGAVATGALSPPPATEETRDVEQSSSGSLPTDVRCAGCARCARGFVLAAAASAMSTLSLWCWSPLVTAAALHLMATCVRADACVPRTPDWRGSLRGWLCSACDGVACLDGTNLAPPRADAAPPCRMMTLSRIVGDLVAALPAEPDAPPVRAAARKVVKRPAGRTRNASSRVVKRGKLAAASSGSLCSSDTSSSADETDAGDASLVASVNAALARPPPGSAADPCALSASTSASATELVASMLSLSAAALSLSAASPYFVHPLAFDPLVASLVDAPPPAGTGVPLAPSPSRVVPVPRPIVPRTSTAVTRAVLRGKKHPTTRPAVSLFRVTRTLPGMEETTSDAPTASSDGPQLSELSRAWWERALRAEVPGADSAPTPHVHAGLATGVFGPWRGTAMPQLSIGCPSAPAGDTDSCFCPAGRAAACAFRCSYRAINCDPDGLRSAAAAPTDLAPEMVPPSPRTRLDAAAAVLSRPLCPCKAVGDWGGLGRVAFVSRHGREYAPPPHEAAESLEEAPTDATPWMRGLCGSPPHSPFARVPAPSGAVPPPLRFSGAFEGGNLAAAVRVGAHSYDLFVSPDVGTAAHTQWFAFALHTPAGTAPASYAFTLCNVSKPSALLASGGKPMILLPRRLVHGADGYDDASPSRSYDGDDDGGGDATAGEGGPVWTHLTHDVVAYSVHTMGTTAPTSKPVRPSAARPAAPTTSTRAGARSTAAATSVPRTASSSGVRNRFSKDPTASRIAASSSSTKPRSSATSGDTSKKPVGGGARAKRAAALPDKPTSLLSFSTPPLPGGITAIVAFGATYGLTSLQRDLAAMVDAPLTRADALCVTRAGHVVPLVTVAEPILPAILADGAIRAVSGGDVGGADDADRVPGSPDILPWSGIVGACSAMHRVCSKPGGSLAPFDSFVSAVAAYIAADMASRPVVVVSGRVHPAEVSGSFVVRGLLKTLTQSHSGAIHSDDAPESTLPHAAACALRTRCVTYIVPMLNPDGVVVGNTRTGLSGLDLNRQWSDPTLTATPTIRALKTLIGAIRIKQKRSIAAFVDIHGHSRSRGVFLFGCPGGGADGGAIAPAPPAPPARANTMPAAPTSSSRDGHDPAPVRPMRSAASARARVPSARTAAYRPAAEPAVPHPAAPAVSSPLPRVPLGALSVVAPPTSIPALPTVPATAFAASGSSPIIIARALSPAASPPNLSKRTASHSSPSPPLASPSPSLAGVCGVPVSIAAPLRRSTRVASSPARAWPPSARPAGAVSTSTRAQASTAQAAAVSARPARSVCTAPLAPARANGDRPARNHGADRSGTPSASAGSGTATSSSATTLGDATGPAGFSVPHGVPALPDPAPLTVTVDVGGSIVRIARPLRDLGTAPTRSGSGTIPASPTAGGPAPDADARGALLTGPTLPIERVFTALAATACPHIVPSACTFGIPKSKLSTGRVVAFRELGARLSFTLEASMSGGPACNPLCDVGGDSACRLYSPGVLELVGQRLVVALTAAVVLADAHAGHEGGSSPLSDEAGGGPTANSRPSTPAGRHMLSGDDRGAASDGGATLVTHRRTCGELPACVHAGALLHEDRRSDERWLNLLRMPAWRVAEAPHVASSGDVSPSRVLFERSASESPCDDGTEPATVQLTPDADGVDEAGSGSDDDDDDVEDEFDDEDEDEDDDDEDEDDDDDEDDDADDLGAVSD